MRVREFFGGRLGAEGQTEDQVPFLLRPQTPQCSILGVACAECCLCSDDSLHTPAITQWAVFQLYSLDVRGGERSFSSTVSHPEWLHWPGPGLVAKVGAGNAVCLPLWVTGTCLNHHLPHGTCLIRKLQSEMECQTFTLSSRVWMPRSDAHLRFSTLSHHWIALGPMENPGEFPISGSLGFITPAQTCAS